MFGKKAKKGDPRSPAPPNREISSGETSSAGYSAQKRAGSPLLENERKKIDSKQIPSMESQHLENELSDLDESELSECIGSMDLGVTSYAGAASKPKIDTTLVVYFHKSEIRREPVQKAHFDEFMQKILAELSESQELIAKINIDWSSYSMGRGIIACLDHETISYVKSKAKNFCLKSNNDLKFRVWTKNEFGDRDIFEGFLHGHAWKEKKGLEVLRWILSINGLKQSKPSLILYKKHEKGVFLRFEADSALTSALKNKSLRLKAGICVLRLKHKHLQANRVENSVDSADN